MRRRLIPFALLTFAALALAAPASAQYPSCPETATGDASAAFEEGNRLLTEAIAAARQHQTDRQHELAQQALDRFDAQCAAGDESALAERGAALALLGERLRAAQSYDALLGLATVDARTRHRVEPNLERGVVNVSWSGGTAQLLVDGVAFGPLPRTRPLRIPPGEHALEARAEDGHVLASVTVTASAEAPVDAALVAETPVAVVAPPPPETHPIENTPPPPTTTHHLVASHDATQDAGGDSILLPVGIATAVAAGAFLATAIALHVVAEGRAQTYRGAPCNGAAMPVTPSCGAVLDEYNATFPAAIAFDVLTAAAAIGASVMLGIELSRPHSHETAVACSTSGLGLACTGAF